MCTLRPKIDNQDYDFINNAGVAWARAGVLVKARMFLWGYAAEHDGHEFANNATNLKYWNFKSILQYANLGNVRISERYYSPYNEEYGKRY